MKHRNIDAPWDTDEPYVRINPSAPYKEVKYNDHKGFVAGPVVDVKNGQVVLNNDFWNAFNHFNQVSFGEYTIETKNSFISGNYDSSKTSINRIYYFNEHGAAYNLEIYSPSNTKPTYLINDCDVISTIKKLDQSHKATFTFGEYGEIELFGECTVSGIKCYFTNGKPCGNAGIYQYNDGELDCDNLWKKLSKNYLSDESIGKVAYNLWEATGRLEGQSEKNWRDAKWQMETLLEVDYDIYKDLGLVWPGNAKQIIKTLFYGILHETA